MPDTQLAQVAVSLDYYYGWQRHNHKLGQLTIPARGAEQVDVGAILAAGQPDADGDAIPPGVTLGGYSVRKVGPRIDKTLITEALVFDRQAKSYLTFYNTCCAFSDIQFSPSSLTGTPGGTGQLNIRALSFCSGGTVDVTTSGRFASYNSSVATVGASSGYASLVAPGNTTLTSHLDFWQMVQFLDPCILAAADNGAPTAVSCSPALSASPQQQTCDGTTVYRAGLVVSGTAVSHITRIQLSTSTDNVIVIELLGQPYVNTLCPASQPCFLQDYKAHSYPPSPSGNIKWNVAIYCDNHTTADLQTTVYQPFRCL